MCSLYKDNVIIIRDEIVLSIDYYIDFKCKKFLFV